jgi:cysteinyl-tRNA synthetase
MPNPIYIYNSSKGEKELFQPENPNNVKIYSCGPTVYNYNHIGNFRSYIFVDILRRTLKLLGYTLNQTMNITDIDDKIINQSIEKGISTEEFTEPWIKAFFEDLNTLNIEKVEHYPKATDSIDEMLHIISHQLFS